MPQQRVMDHVRAQAPIWREVVLLDSVGSTSDVVAQDPRLWVAVAADQQVAGKGRLGRQWDTPAGVAIAVSALVPALPQLGWLPLLTGLAVHRAIGEVAEVRTELKWPNDVLIPGPDGGKVAGVLSQLTPEGVIVGIGVNVSQTREQLPVPTATSLACAGTDVDRFELLGQVLIELARVHRDAATPDGPPVSDGPVGAAYRAVCASIGTTLEVNQPDGSVVRLSDTSVDDQGRLCGVTGSGASVALAAGDVVHVRPGSGSGDSASAQDQEPQR